MTKTLKGLPFKLIRHLIAMWLDCPRQILTVEKTKLLGNVFIYNQINYAPLIWMFANKSSIDKILKIHERTLQIVYDVYDES